MNMQALMLNSYHLSLGFIAVKRHYDHGNSYKEKHFIGAGLQFRGLVLYCRGLCVQTDMVLEK